jgi:hypothetical protein
MGVFVQLYHLTAPTKNDEIEKRPNSPEMDRVVSSKRLLRHTCEAVAWIFLLLLPGGGSIWTNALWRST